MRLTGVVPSELFGTVSIHAPWEGCDAKRVLATAEELVSIHAPWEGCDFLHQPRELLLLVSIHAPWEGCDSAGMLVPCLVRVSIHAPWEGCDLNEEPSKRRATRFQFTHPGKGATKRDDYEGTDPLFQFTHPGKGATVPFAPSSP